jgi:hypothetical protein
MLLLIDGYNLLHASGVASRHHGRTGLERARLGLLDFLASTITPQERARTTVVFDAADAPPGLPAIRDHAGMTIRFVRDHACADELIEHLIEQCRAPRSLTVVSSDHRLHRAARRRKAQPIDSEAWLAQLVAARRKRSPGEADASAKPTGPLSPTEVAHWVEVFSHDPM